MTSMMKVTQEAPLSAARKVMVILHPDAWQARDASDDIQNRFKQRNIQADVRVITAEDPASKLVECAVLEQYDGVVAAGGDGTVQQVAACLMNRSIPLGILPLGTMNNIAFSIGIPADLEGACAVIEAALVRKIDMGTVNGLPFLEVANVGAEVDMSEIIEATRHQPLMQVLRPFSKGVSRLLGLRRHAVTLTIDGKRFITRTWEVTVCNMPYYGLRYRPSETARIDDGLLDVVILRHRGLAGFMGHYWDLLWQRRRNPQKVSVLHARRIEITARHPLPVGISGYHEGTTPVTIEVAPGALAVYAPLPMQTNAARADNPIANIMQSMAPAGSKKA
ncbi:MAG: diacylglycerol kinase family lipid kinase [Ktedonobacterales bacterium]|nr:diacylglycerol kinase family lipid kinase [Ktedonobacterales bacterium]